MIARIQGTLVDIEESWVVVDVAGVGYRVFAPASTISKLNLDDQVTFHVSTQVREDAFQLYGFTSKPERQAFQALLGVTGVGARIALAALSTMTRNDLAKAVAAENVAALKKIPGVGKRVAQRMIVDLSGKLPVSFEPTESTPEPKPDDQLPLALAQLGFKRSEIQRALEDISAAGAQSEPLPDRIKRALKLLGGL